MLRQITAREKFIYELSDDLGASLRRVLCCCCCRPNKHQAFRREMFEKALKKIDDELDIRHISRELRTLKFISNILLTKD